MEPWIPLDPPLPLAPLPLPLAPLPLPLTQLHITKLYFTCNLETLYQQGNREMSSQLFVTLNTLTKSPEPFSRIPPVYKPYDEQKLIVFCLAYGQSEVTSFLASNSPKR